MNQLLLIGRLTDDVKVKTTSNGKRLSQITLAVPRNYKNEEGSYDTDFIPCVLWNNVAETTSEYCHKGDMLAIKGKVQLSVYEDDNGEQHSGLEVIADKITFLSPKKTA